MALRLNGQDMSDAEVAAYRAGNVAGSPASTGIGYTEDGLAYLWGNNDSKINAINQQSLWNREDLLRKEGNEWDSRQLDRLIQAAERNGINPIFLLDSMTGGSSASYSTSASKTSNYEASERTDAANSAKIVGAIITALAMIAAHAL